MQLNIYVNVCKWKQIFWKYIPTGMATLKNFLFDTELIYKFLFLSEKSEKNTLEIAFENI